MNALRLAVFSIALLGFGQLAHAEESCPTTVGSDNVFLEPWPKADTWYGSESLAVILPRSGIWSTTYEGMAISVKLVWYAAGFQSGMERDFAARIERLDEGPNDARISSPSNVGFSDGVKAIMTGVDFKSEGCWRVIGEYRGQTLEFVVRTVDYEALERKKASN